jgi:hypothetical protein
VLSARARRRAVVAGAATVALGSFGAAALADQVANSVDNSVDVVAEVMALSTGQAMSTTLYVLNENLRDGDSVDTCSLNGAARIKLNVSSSNPNVASVTPSVTIDGENAGAPITLTGVGAGSATVTVTRDPGDTSASGRFVLDTATFTVNVAAPPNTGPSVDVDGVVGGASYATGSVPAATCKVTDAEDGPSTFDATLGAVSGTYAADGIGSQEATCSYTDKGGLKASSSVTYLIVDPSAPAITATRTPADPDGENGWYKSDVSLAWDLDEPQSPSSLQKLGCESQSITADQDATTYSCSATSAGGAAPEQTVSIKRDATKPTISGARDRAANSAGWNNTDVTVTWTCADNLSGVASCSPAETLMSEGRDQSANGSVKDDAGNGDSAAVSSINIDKSKPNAPNVSADRAPDYAGDGGWYKGSVTAHFVSAGDPDLSNGQEGSGVAPSSVPADAVLVQSGTAGGTVMDEAGNESPAGSLTVKIDNTKPTIKTTCPTAPVVKGAAASASWEAADGESGLKTDAAGKIPLDTATVGKQSASIPAGTATDNVGNESTAASCSYTVVYDFSGFFQPIDNKDAAGNYILNKAKAGSAIPIKFSLSGDQGLGILSGTPQTASVGCQASNVDALEEYGTATVSGLKYDAIANQYIYNWKTQAGWAGTCRQLIVTLDDGTTHRANFNFVK